MRMKVLYPLQMSWFVVTKITNITIIITIIAIIITITTILSPSLPASSLHHVRIIRTAMIILSLSGSNDLPNHMDAFRLAMAAFFLARVSRVHKRSTKILSLDDFCHEKRGDLMLFL